jgi:hypothetical protein
MATTAKKSTAKKSKTNKSSKPIRMKKETSAPKAEKSVKTAKPAINIISALYGVEGTTIEVKDNMKVGRKITNKLAGSDPAPKLKKQLTVVAEIAGERVERTFAEGEILKF